MTPWRYWQGNGLGIHRSLVRILAGHHCVADGSGLRQASYTCVPLSPSSIIWHRPTGPREVISLGGKVTEVLVESNGSLTLNL